MKVTYNMSRGFEEGKQMNKSIISMAVSKGGQGKTVSVTTISSLLAMAGYKTLVIDLDLQQNLTNTMMTNEEFELVQTGSITKLLMEEMPLQELKSIIFKTKIEGLDIIPSMSELEFLPYLLYDEEVHNDNQDIYLILRKNLKKLLESDYDYILMDTSPWFSKITNSFLIASDKVLIPLEADNYGYKGLSDLYQKIINLNEQYDRDTALAGIFLTRVDPRTNRFKGISEGYGKELMDVFIPTYIKRMEVIGQSTTLFEPLVLIDKKCPAISAYIEIMQSVDLLDGDHFKELKRNLGKR